MKVEWDEVEVQTCNQGGLIRLATAVRLPGVKLASIMIVKKSRDGDGSATTYI